MRRRGKRARRNGFALVLAIWAIGLLALLIQTFLTTARFRLHAGANIAAAARAEALAEAGVALALLDLTRRSSDAASLPRFSSAPSLCATPGGGWIAITVESESGKVDLNAASADLLRRLFDGAGLGTAQATRLTEAVVDFRSEGLSPLQSAYQADARPFGPRKGPFWAAQELDQVLGVSPDVYALLRSHVTVYGVDGGVDPAFATPELRVRLGLGDRGGRSLASGSGAAFAVHVESLSDDGARFARGAIIGSGAPGRTLWTVREWRTERARWNRLMDEARTASPPPC